MFKSIRSKIVIMFVLLTVSLMIVVGTFMTSSTDSFYHEEFMALMHNVFTDTDIRQLEDTMRQENDLSKLFDNIEAHSGQIGIDSFRNLYILDGKTGRAIDEYSTNQDLASSLEVSPNIIAAMRGRTGDVTNVNAKYMDFAVPLKDADGTVRYIVYVKDSKEETNTILKKIFYIMFQALVLGLALSVVFGVILSRTIISPIFSLTRKAEKISSGDFGETIDVQSSDEIGRLTQTFNDMSSELRETLRAIQSEKDKLETILLYMTDGIIAFDATGAVLHINPTARQMLQLEEKEDVQFSSVFNQEDISLAQLTFLEHNRSKEYEMTRNGRELKCYFATFRTNDAASGIVVVLQDITEQQKLDNARREFVANVSHELRTPITAVKSYAETMLYELHQNEFDKEEFMTFLQVINDESDRMTRLIKDLLLLSRLDYNQVKGKNEPFDLPDLIEGLVKKLEISAKEKSQVLTYERINTLPVFYGDKDRIAQVLVNILSNAIKYTPEGGKITVTSLYMYESAYIKIKDTGIGIPAEDLDHIFERFYRVDKARSRQQGGTGLGLAIAKEIVTSAGGEITIQSQLEKGTEVVVKLPILQPPEEEVPTC